MTAEHLLRQMGATGTLKGFHYALHMIERVEREPTAVSVLKGLYLDAAQRFGVSVSAVERDLRTLTRICWSENQGFMKEVAGKTFTRQPTNSEFLDMMGAFLRLQKQ